MNLQELLKMKRFWDRFNIELYDLIIEAKKELKKVS